MKSSRQKTDFDREMDKFFCGYSMEQLQKVWSDSSYRNAAKNRNVKKAKQMPTTILSGSNRIARPHSAKEKSINPIPSEAPNGGLTGELSESVVRDFKNLRNCAVEAGGCRPRLRVNLQRGGFAFWFDGNNTREIDSTRAIQPLIHTVRMSGFWGLVQPVIAAFTPYRSEERRVGKDC